MTNESAGYLIEQRGGQPAIGDIRLAGLFL